MSYLVLARKYRPATFSSIAGQEHVTRTLSNSIKRNKIAHAYLFCGPRGVGKTSVARVFSKALNCKNGPTSEPCGECANCLEVASGRSLAVLEIDGASHNSVEDIRGLIDTLRSLPAPGWKYKIYIIDEVHMLSIAAFNALLKSLEEPPPNTIFIFATTEAQKIPDTVISRCQRHDFRAIDVDVIEDQLKMIAKKEEMQVEPAVFRMIARISDGSLRDAESLLDRVQAFADSEITVKDTSQVLGTVDHSILYNISRAVFSRDSQRALEIVSQTFSSGLDPRLFLREFATHWREILFAKFGGEESLKKLGLNQDDIVDLKRQVDAISAQDIQDLVLLAHRGADAAMRSQFPKYAVEALVVRMAAREPVQDLAAIIAKLENHSPAAVVPEQRRAADIKPMRSATVSPVTLVPTPLPPLATQPKSGQLNWYSFVTHAENSKARLIAEQLKRLHVIQFGEGHLSVSGPSFCIDYLNQPDNRQKLEALLQGFVSCSAWRIEMKVNEAVALSSSGETVVQKEDQRRKSLDQEARDEVAQHPAVKNLQKVFPGATVEKVVVKG